MPPLEVKGFHLFKVDTSMTDTRVHVGSDRVHCIKTCLFPASLYRAFPVNPITPKSGMAPLSSTEAPAGYSNKNRNKIRGTRWTSAEVGVLKNISNIFVLLCSVQLILLGLIYCSIIIYKHGFDRKF